MRLGVVWAVALSVFSGAPGLATAQGNCQAIPAGPDRTDCYIVQTRIYRQKSELAATIARQQADEAIYRKITGERPRKKSNRAVPGGQNCER